MKMYSSAPFVRELRRGREKKKEKRKNRLEERERKQKRMEREREGKKRDFKGTLDKKWPSEVVVLMKINLFVSDH